MNAFVLLPPEERNLQLLLAGAAISPAGTIALTKAVRRGSAVTNDAGHIVGQGHHSAKLSDHDCYLIHELRAEGISQAAIAEKFEVSRHTIESICQGRRRQYLAVGQKATGRRRT
jgi:DNA-binding XRE family transcriptional regulator